MARKKTTLMIDEDLYDAIRLYAVKRRTSVSQIVAEAARQYVVPKSVPGTLPVGPNVSMVLPAGVDRRSTVSILDHLDSLDATEEAS
jgi:hypothetical protein